MDRLIVEREEGWMDGWSLGTCRDMQGWSTQEERRRERERERLIQTSRFGERKLERKKRKKREKRSEVDTPEKTHHHYHT